MQAKLDIAIAAAVCPNAAAERFSEIDFCGFGLAFRYAPVVGPKTRTHRPGANREFAGLQVGPDRRKSP